MSPRPGYPGTEDLKRGLRTIVTLWLCSESSAYFTHADDRIGGRYKKALYVEYTDDTFTIKANRSSSELHLGFLGPVIRAEVGDEINVFFKNQVNSPELRAPWFVSMSRSNYWLERFLAIACSIHWLLSLKRPVCLLLTRWGSFQICGIFPDPLIGRGMMNLVKVQENAFHRVWSKGY